MELNLDYEVDVFVNTANMDEETWLECPRKGIGGSDAAAVIGISPYKMTRDVYFEKLGRQPNQEDEAGGVDKEVGKRLEDLVFTGLRRYRRKLMMDIVAKFGIDALDIIENDPKRLLEIKRITEKRLEQILDSYAFSKGLKEIMTFLGSYGVTPNKAKKIQEHFGSRAIDVIQHSLYMLCEISGFGFKTVDEIAGNINFQPADTLRLEGGISFVLEDAKDSGDLFLLKEDLLERVFTLLTERVPEGIIDEGIVRKALLEMCAYGKLYDDQDRIYLPQFFHFEEQTARLAAKMLKRKKESFPDLEQYMREVQRDRGVLLSDKQADAVRMCMENSFSVITGKTTVLKIILAVYEELHPGKEILMAAPTGRATRKNGGKYRVSLCLCIGSYFGGFRL